MSYKEINASELLAAKNIPVVDVRSPSEYNSGHIPGAFNLSLFSDEERAQIGITYKQKGKEAAVILGLEFVGPRLKSMVEQANELAVNKKLNIHCWRGGQRSQSVAWLLQKAGFEISVLKNGYKAYRNFIHEYFETEQFRFLILSGRTGSAKTSILRAMIELNEQVLDIEALAHHKGSAFGGIGEQEQEINEQFENNLFQNVYTLNTEKIIWIENESRTIGRNFIPENLWKKIKGSPLINIEMNLEERLKHLVTCYDLDDQEALIHSFEKIVRRLGLENANKAIDFVKENKYKEAVQIALKYYDKCYDYNLKENTSLEIYTLKFKEMNVPEIANELVQFKLKHFGK